MTTTQKKTFLFIINDSPYGNERPYNAIRLAMNLSKRAGAVVRVFLIGDGVNCAIANQKTANGYYNIERMIRVIVRQGAVST